MKDVLKELLFDTLKPNGKFEHKRIASMISFNVAITYAFTPIFFPKFEVLEFVFWGFITYSATAIGMTVWNKKIDKDL